MKPRPFHHQRPLTACAAFYGAGVAMGVFLPWQPRLILSGLVLCVLAAAVLHRMGKRRVLGWMGAFLFLGLFLSGRIVHKPLPAEGKYQITGIVMEDVQLRPDGTAQGYLVKASGRTEEGEIMPLGTVYWTYYPDEQNFLVPTDGQQVSFLGTVYHPSGRSNPFGFDFRMFLWEKGIHAGVSGAKDMAVIGTQERGLASLLYRCRNVLSERLEQVFGEASHLPRALLLGEKYRLPQEVQDSFADAGVAHVLSVSGLHVSLLGYCVMFLVPKKWGHKIRFCFMALFLLIYCGMIGFPAPAVRAALFMLIASFRRIVWRGKDWLTTVSVAFLLILMINPMALFSGSFQLSFGAVMGIFVLLPRLEQRMAFRKDHFIWKEMRITLAATAGLLLPMVQIFHRVSVVGLIVNPLVCLVFMAILPLYAVLMVLGFVWLPAAQTLAAPFQIITTGITDFLSWAGDLPFATLNMPHLPWYVAAAFMVAFVLLSGLVVMKKGKRIGLACGLCLASILFWQGTLCRDVQYIQLDAGQADAAIICDGRETVLIDTGEYGGDAAAYLRSTCRRADTLVITHLHKDHFLGVMQLMENHVEIGRLLLPVGAKEVAADAECIALLQEIEEAGVPVYAMAAGQYFETNRCRFEAKWPIRGTIAQGQDANRYSLVLLCDLDGVRLLSCADGEGAYEQYAAADADIIKVAHHGSRDGTQETFLDQVTPAVALITGNGRSDTLPHPETLSRLEKRSISVYNTGEWGAVTVICRDGQAKITPYLATPNKWEQP